MPKSFTSFIRRIVPGRSVPDSISPAPPEYFSISSDALRLVLINYVRAQESALKWVAYSGLALSLWASLAVTNFTFSTAKYGLDGKQWQLLFIVAASYSSLRAVAGFAGYLRRPTVDTVMGQILSRADFVQNVSGLCLLKYQGRDNKYRILVYRDLLWDCYLLPHYNIANTAVKNTNDPRLISFMSGEIGVAAEDITVERIPNAELRSRKFSAHHHQITSYEFSFFIVVLRSGAALPTHLQSKQFTYKGRPFEWLTIAELENDKNTALRNIDVTRFISANATQLFIDPPDSLGVS